jgi:hypothetical protein
LLSSLEIVWSWATPPPLSTRLSAPSTSSISGLRPLRSSGITSPLRSSVGLGSVGGAERETNFSPSRLVCRICAVALAGSLVSRRISTVTSACPSTSFTSVTLPTETSSTLTAESGTRSRTSGNCTCSVIGFEPVSAPPGSGRS